MEFDNFSDINNKENIQFCDPGDIRAYFTIWAPKNVSVIGKQVDNKIIKTTYKKHELGCAKTLKTSLEIWLTELFPFRFKYHLVFMIYYYIVESIGEGRETWKGRLYFLCEGVFLTLDFRYEVLYFINNGWMIAILTFILNYIYYFQK